MVSKSLVFQVDSPGCSHTASGAQSLACAVQDSASPVMLLYTGHEQRGSDKDVFAVQTLLCSR